MLSLHIIYLAVYINSASLHSHILSSVYHEIFAQIDARTFFLLKFEDTLESGEIHTFCGDLMHSSFWKSIFVFAFLRKMTYTL